MIIKQEYVNFKNISKELFINDFHIVIQNKKRVFWANLVSQEFFRNDPWFFWQGNSFHCSQVRKSLNELTAH